MFAYELIIEHVLIMLFKLFTDLWPPKLLAHNQWNQPLPVLRENQMMLVGNIAEYDPGNAFYFYSFITS